MADLGAALGAFLAAYGLIAILVVMLLKEIGLPVPVPSDLIMITAGVQAATGSYGLLELVVAIEVAIVVGGSIHFLLVRGAGRAFVHRVGPYVGLTPARLEAAAGASRGAAPGPSSWGSTCRGPGPACWWRRDWRASPTGP
ncbi:MAG: hypothetical protein HYY05_04710 [Chloroflexi bacterium]|nr:hypothetical protein [Chloroflexota bacterium]